MSSSNRSGGVCDAVLVRKEQKVGPMRLPISRADDFVDQFNRIYGGMGMALVPRSDDGDEATRETERSPTAEQEKIPDDSKVAGDSEGFVMFDLRSEWAVTGGCRATRNVFYSMLSSVLRAPMSYFETTPM